MKGTRWRQYSDRTVEYDLNFVSVNAQQRFYDKLAGVTEPEQKRKIIGEEFIRVFEEEAKKIGAVDFLVQGTIYPDVIEIGSWQIRSDQVSPQRWGLPDHVDFKEIVEPLRMLFKDEVRKLVSSWGSRIIWCSVSRSRDLVSASGSLVMSRRKR